MKCAVETLIEVAQSLASPLFDRGEDDLLVLMS